MNSVATGTARLLCLLAASTPAALAAEIELFVTDYEENPATEQRPLADQPLVFARPREVTIATSDGRTVTIPSPITVHVRKDLTADPREARLFAARGEYEPFSFLLRPGEALADVFIAAGDLVAEGGATISSADVKVASVEGFHGGGRDILMPLGRPWRMSAHSTEFFWCTVRVPPEARPGLYRGELTVTSAGRPIGAIRILLEVLPIRLDDPPLAIGLNYSRPDEDRDGTILEAQLKDMREHGMTCVAPLYEWHQPVHDTDTAELGSLLEAYKKAGFPGPLYWAAPMGLQLTDLAGYGDETSRRWQQKYIKVMRLMHEEVRKHDVPTLFSIGDELTNKGMEGVKIAARLAKFVWEELPEIATTSDMNGYREVMAMAPYLNVATFNNGWDGADGHNEGRRLLNKGFLEELRRATSAIPWFVNAGCGRFPFGFFIWKMGRYGVKGKIEWYYSLRNEAGSLARTQGAVVYPTLDYERCREGIDDLKYLCALESLIAAADPSLRAVKTARELVNTIADGIADDWTLYEGKRGRRFPDDGFARLDPEKVASFGRLNAIRRELANAILALEGAAASAARSDPPPDVSGLPSFVAGGMYLGRFEMGLYPGGTSEIPEAHAKAGERAAAAIRPLDEAGNPDEKGGRILGLVLGHSNCEMYFGAFQESLARRRAELHPRFELLNAAVGGQQLPQIRRLEGPVWDRAAGLLARPGYSPRQVQVLFLHTTYHEWRNPGRPPGPFPETMQRMQADLAAVLEHAVTTWPNLRIAYLTCDGLRRYTGFEPHVWQEAFAFKWLIERQIKGEEGTAFEDREGKPRRLPWLAWGPSIWDGTWDASYFTDGVHPAPKARAIFVQKYWDRLAGDPVARGWFLAPR